MFWKPLSATLGCLCSRCKPVVSLMSKPSVQLRIVASREHDFSREKLAHSFKRAMIAHLRAHTKDTNINPETLLTTDYLNHFNEIIMLLELVPTAPTLFNAELAQWEHKSYEEHFTHSGFRDKELAITGYRNAPEQVRHDFDSSVADLEQEMVMLLQQVQKKIDAGDTEGLSMLCREGVPHLQSLVQIIAGIVNGSQAGTSETDTANAQSEIDALFD